MSRRVSLALGLGLGLAVLAYSATASAGFTAPWVPDSPEGWALGRNPYRAAESIADSWGAPVGAQRMLAYQMATESHGQAAAALGLELGAPPWVQLSRASSAARAREAEAARIAYARAGRLTGPWASAGWGRASWSFGSGGLYGLLPANGLATLLRAELGPAWIAERKAGPWDVFDPQRGTACYLDFMRRVLKLGGVTRWIDIKLASASLDVLRNKKSARALSIEARAPALESRAGLPAGFALSQIDSASRSWLLAMNMRALAWN